MSRYGLSFQESKGRGFVESVALERNARSERITLSTGVSAATVYTDVRERLIHQLPNFSYHVHTDLCTSDVVLGTAGALNSVGINGSGWARVHFIVKGVACRYPVSGTVSVTFSQANRNRFGSAMMLQSSQMQTYRRPTFSINSLDDTIDLNPIYNSVITNRHVILNGFEDIDALSETPEEIHRIVSVSAQLPATFTAVFPQLDWTEFGRLPTLYTGGATDPLLTVANPATVRGTPISNGKISSFNPGINTLDFDGNPMFSNPSNIVQLQIRLLGWRPDAGPRQEEFREMATS